MPATPPPSSATGLLSDPLLRDAPTVCGFKVLEPAVLYAKVGQGGMGAVYRGRHFKLDLDVAVKCLKPSLSAEAPEFVLRFEREARLAASLAHQNVVRVMDVQQKHGLHYLIMEFVRGESARERVERKGRLGEQEALAILLGAASGLAEAHARGIVHRDIKPDNLLVSVDGRVKLADLGLAKAKVPGDQSLSLASGVMGTPQYMAPEQWDSPDVGPAADVWALGATLYFLLTGAHAITGDTMLAIARRVQERDFPPLRTPRPDLREAVHALFERCVARDPAQRFADAQALVRALRPLVDVDEAALADASAATNVARSGVVSPPPRQTLLEIRAAIETGVAIDPEAPTLRSPGGTEPMAAPRGPRGRGRPRRAWLFGVGALLLGCAFAAWAGDWFDTTDWESTQRYARARSLFSEADELLPQPGRLDDAIERLEQVLVEWPDYELAKPKLALALDKRAEQLAARDLDGAVTASARATELDPANAAAQARFEQLQQALRDVLVKGVAITSPAPGDTLPARHFTVRGTVTDPRVRGLKLAVMARSKLLIRPKYRPVAIVAGEWSAEVDADGAGDWQLGLVAVGAHDVAASLPLLPVAVAGVFGAADAKLDPTAAAPARVLNAAGIVMVPIPVRTFRMGSLDLALGHRDNETQHEVTLTAPYWLGSTEVTRRQWRTLMPPLPWPLSTAANADDLPATYVTWNEAVAFCDALTERERAAGRVPDGYRYCLPSEAQWELACRGGGDGTFAPDVTWENLRQHARYAESQDSDGTARPPNPFGLYDMHGNAAEWCADCALLTLGTNLPVTPFYKDGVVEPLSTFGSVRIVRGGSYESPAVDLRCAARAAAAPDTRGPAIGFRPALAKR